MKLFASKPKGKHVKAKGKNTENGTPKKGLKKLNLGVKIAIGVVLGITALALGAMAYLKLAVEPPDVRLTPNPPPVVVDGDNDSTKEVDPNEPEVHGAEVRDKEKYTLLILGSDDGNGNTDVIMTATFDTSATRGYSLNVVNIPRDTLVNVSWYTKKANSIYSVEKKNGTEEDEYSAVRQAFSKLLGYEVDYVVVVDLQAFAALVDAVGGVEFDVPRFMEYKDPVQNLDIYISKGRQIFNGKQALGLVRWRQNNKGGGYPDGDIGRIALQQNFLSAAISQILANKSSINITSIANIFLKYVDTDLKLNHVVWFGKELFKLNAEDVSFGILPGDINDSFNGNSYVSIYVNEWLDMINEKLNPFSIPITTGNVSILTRGADKKLYVTNGVWEGKQSWGGGSSSSGSSNNSGDSTPKPTATPTPTATPKPTDTTPTESPVITGDPLITDNPVESPVVTDTPVETVEPFPPDVTPTPTPTQDATTPPPATPPDDSGSLS